MQESCPAQKVRMNRLQQIQSMIGDLVGTCCSPTFVRKYESCPQLVKQMVLQSVLEGFSENADLEIALKRHDFGTLKKLLEAKLCDDAVIPPALVHELRMEMDDAFAEDQFGFKLEQIRITCLKLYMVINKA